MKQYQKAVTFSYDDGVEQDQRLVQLFNQYHVKCTFNLNSGIETPESTWQYREATVRRMSPEMMQGIYDGHEIAVHGTVHAHPNELKPAEFEEEFLADRVRLEQQFGTKIFGMAYAFGEYNDTVVDYLKENGFLYGRNIDSTHNFRLQTDLLRFCPTCHHNDDDVFDLIETFLNDDSEEPKLFYIWGHAYEFDGFQNWDRMERILRLLSGKDDVFYGTNQECFRQFGLI